MLVARMGPVEGRDLLGDLVLGRIIANLGRHLDFVVAVGIITIAFVVGKFTVIEGCNLAWVFAIAMVEFGKAIVMDKDLDCSFIFG